MNKQHFQFQGFELDWPGRRLSRSGADIAIEPKCLEVIHFLLKHRDRAVSRDELADQVWADRVISDTVISQTIRKARKALQDDGDRQAVIATVRGYGYRFVAPVEEVAGRAESAPELPARVAPPPRSWPPAIRWGFGLGLGALLVAVVAGMYFASPARAPDIERIAVAVRFELADAIDPDQAWLARSLPELLAQGLARSERLVVYPPSVVAAQGADGSGPDELLARLGAEVLIEGRLAREGGDWRLALTLHRRDGEQQSLILADAEPMALVLRAARRLAGSDAPASDEFWPDADSWLVETFARGMAALGDGEPARAHDYFRLVVDSAPDHPSGLYQLAVTSQQTGDVVASDRLLDELEALIDDQPSRLTRLAANQRALNHWRRGQLDLAGEALEQMLAGSEQAGHALDTGNAHLNLAIVRSNLGQVEQAETHFLAALNHYSRIAYQPGRALVANSLGAQAWRQGRRDQAETWHRQALELRRQLGNPQHVAQSLVNLAAIESARLNAEAAERYLEEARLIYRALAQPQHEAFVLSSLAAHHIDSGRYSSARSLLERALQLAEETQSVQQAAEVEARLGVLDKLEGNPISGIARLEQALDRYREIGATAAQVETALVLAEYRARAGQLDQAETELDKLADEHDLADNPFALGAWLRARALVAEHRNDPESARALLEESLVFMRQSNRDAEVVRTAVRLGLMLLDAGQFDELGGLLNSLPPGSDGRAGVLVLNARLALAQGDVGSAHDRLLQARELAGAGWRSEERELLRQVETEVGLAGR
ncbi:MAG: hypothetical protein EA418_01960 [Wenzhouxiangellaceae bacterium]|nr:MAG: hypothetical protein EA418_01960 [Wenzhouxiangellaceae bacterium]